MSAGAGQITSGLVQAPSWQAPWVWHLSVGAGQVTTRTSWHCPAQVHFSTTQGLVPQAGSHGTQPVPVPGSMGGWMQSGLLIGQAACLISCTSPGGTLD